MKNVNPIFFLLVIATLFLIGCANKVTPTGGDKDILPPELLNSVPQNNSVNFTSKTIVLTFDEYIQLKEISKQVVISPPMLPAPKFEIRKKSIIIELGDSLAPNTTYTINFGNAIVDNNESIPLPGFRYIFSTGSYIDSLKISGTIVDALTNKPHEGSLAILYDSSVNDTLILKKLPDYFSRADEKGVFHIENIRPGNFRLFALVEKNSNYIFDQADELTGFVAGNFELKDSAKFEIRVSKSFLQKQTIKTSNIQKPGKLFTVFAKPADSLSWEFPDATFEKVIPEFSHMRDTVILYCFPPPADTLNVIWYENGMIVDTIRYQKQREDLLSKTKTIDFTGYQFYPNKGAVLTPETSPFIKWWAPVAQIDSSKITVLKDSVAFPVSINFTDSLKTIMKIEGDWKEGNYSVLIRPGMVTDIYNTSNDSIRSTFTLPEEKTKGSISFKILMNANNQHLLQLVNDKDELIRQRRFDKDLSGIFEMIDPGSYKLRVISDMNKNERWDGGDFKSGQIPETVLYYTEPIVVRSNWEVEIDWAK